jgi:predicted phosphodiesterase
VVVPGNHDVPLYNVLARFLAPLAGYRRVIAGDVEPGFVDDEIAVLGINTARSFVFKGGRVSQSQLARVREALGRLQGGRTRIIVSHHSGAMEKLADCGVDVFVSGHHHATRTAHRRIGRMSVLIVEAGTATSQRTREEPNAFNLLRVAPGRIEVDHYTLRGGNFMRAAADAFLREDAGWRRV